MLSSWLADIVTRAKLHHYSWSKVTVSVGVTFKHIKKVWSWIKQQSAIPPILNLTLREEPLCHLEHNPKGFRSGSRLSRANRVQSEEEVKTFQVVCLTLQVQTSKHQHITTTASLHRWRINLSLTFSLLYILFSFILVFQWVTVAVSTQRKGKKQSMSVLTRIFYSDKCDLLLCWLMTQIMVQLERSL